jgi:phosphate:Na+ symporter
VENLAGVALPGPQAGAPQDLRAAALCDKAIRAAQKVGDSISAEAALSEQAPPIGWNVSDLIGAALAESEAAAKELAVIERDYSAMLASVALGSLTAADALAHIDNARRFERIAYHASRSAAHLLGRGERDK